MIIEDRVTVDAPLERVWPVLCDVPRVATCIPNAHITEVVDPQTYKAKIALKVGPIAVTFGATVVIESLDDATHTARISVQGTEARGRGGVTAGVVTRAISRAGATEIEIRTDAQISGFVATLGGRLIESVAKKAVEQFAENLTRLVR